MAWKTTKRMAVSDWDSSACGTDQTAVVRKEPNFGHEKSKETLADEKAAKAGPRQRRSAIEPG